ncbi:hypothetical protein GCM10023156_25990 [Novipirellula rosea]|uniref:Uncharacterized protein n=1 Tax=Novipirellula rosea TaxID=1031540 RepID=A0ABP8MPQ6_9BACT
MIASIEVSDSVYIHPVATSDCPFENARLRDASAMYCYLAFGAPCKFRISELPASDLDLLRIGPFEGYANAITEADSSGPSAMKSPTGVEAKQDSPEVADSSAGSSLLLSKITSLTTISKTNMENDSDIVSPSGSRGTTGGSSIRKS